MTCQYYSRSTKNSRIRQMILMRFERITQQFDRNAAEINFSTSISHGATPSKSSGHCPNARITRAMNLIGGYLFMVPPPNPPHGDLAAEWHER